MRRQTGNWAEDLGNGIDFFLKLGLVAVFVIPALVIALVVLVLVMVL